jgi:histidinol-phosphate aminotransferase
MRTFSKAFSLAGIRLGYLLGKREVAEQLDKAKLPFSVGIFQQVAGEVILENIEFVQDSVDLIVRERERLFAELKELDGVVPFRSLANFILFGVESREAPFLCRRLYEEGVLLRSLDGPRLKNKLRVTVGLPEENNMFLETLKRELER